MLDLLAAFDTIDYVILLDRLEIDFDVGGAALAWLASCLRDRTQTVCVAKQTTESAKVSCGVPQGSVLGPKMFSAYTTPLGDIVRNHGMRYHAFADDTQIYLFLRQINSWGKSVASVQNCLCGYQLLDD